MSQIMDNKTEGKFLLQVHMFIRHLKRGAQHVPQKSKLGSVLDNVHN